MSAPSELITVPSRPFRYLAGGAQSDFGALNEFRKRHGRGLNDIFTQVVELARSDTQMNDEAHHNPPTQHSCHTDSFTPAVGHHLFTAHPVTRLRSWPGAVKANRCY
jgi:hypothetical protein